MTRANKKPPEPPPQKVDYRTVIDVVTSYIQQHISDVLLLEHLADVAGFSSFHFHRIFAGLMGETLSEYVRRVRLARSVQRLLDTHDAVTSIALAVGYQTPAAFTKAFRLRFGVSPSALRGMNRESAYALLLDEPSIRAQLPRKVSPEIRVLPDWRVLYAREYGVVHYSFAQAAERAFTTLMGYLQIHHLHDRYSARIGITPDDLNTVPHARCRFDAGVVLNADVHIRPKRPLAIQVLPAGRWAIFQHKGAYDTLWQTWNTAYRDWLPRSGERLRDVPPVECYLNNINATPAHELRTEIMIPIA